MQSLTPQTLVDHSSGEPFMSLKGMQLQGAVFDGVSLHECNKETASWTTVEKLAIVYKTSDGNNKKKRAQVPLYQDGSRQLFLLTLQIECANDLIADLSGVCCALNS